MMIPAFSPRQSISHALIVMSVMVSVIGFIFPAFMGAYGFHTGSYMRGDWMTFFMQICLWQFLHSGIIHLLMNSYFLYSAGPAVETRMSGDRFIAFFVTTAIFISGALFFFSPYSLTIGMSGFCTAILSYLCLDLYTTRHPAMMEMVMMLAVNIGI
jgi:membrane associated rhomboid family serine protease